MNMPVRRSDIRVEYSTPSQQRSAFSVRWSVPILSKLGVKRIADFGSGTLRNLKIMEGQFDEVTLIETASGCERLRPMIGRENHVRLLTTKAFEQDRSHYDAIFMVSVLHIIPDPGYRQRMVRFAVTKLNPSGFIVVDVPQSETYYNRRRDVLPRYKDGYLLQHGSYFSFYKSYYSNELDSMFDRADLGLKLFKKIGYTKHLIRIWQLPGARRMS